MRITDRASILIVILIVLLDAFLWREVVRSDSHLGVTSLDVGQGDSTLVELLGGVQILFDAGQPGSASRALEGVLGTEDRYVDVAVVTHPQLDHFGGFRDLLDRYTFGVFIMNGRDDDNAAPGSPWTALMAEIERRGIPIVVLGEGDRIRHGEEVVDVLSPGDEFIGSGEPNDTGLVALVRAQGFRALLTADIGFAVESYLVERYPDLRADILKIGHHGSRFSSGDEFLSAVRPRVALISSGATNRYGHPSLETLERLAHIGGVTVFRTDTAGSVRVMAGGSKLLITTEH